MAFKDFPEQEQGVQLLQRSLERGRLAHAYLFAGHQLGDLEAIARTLAKTLNCSRPARGRRGVAVDCCDECPVCRKIDQGNHADVHWVRPESRSRVITIDQVRALMQEINLKPAEADYKVAIVVAADRLNAQAANAFLKTLEEPPPKSILIQLSTEPQRLLETILSRCLKLNFAGEGSRPLTAAELEWLGKFSDLAAAGPGSCFSRYRLLDVLLQQLNTMKSATEESLSARSPLQRYEDVEKEVRDKWEDELSAAIESEYRRQRAELLVILQRWLRDVWLQTLARAEVQRPGSRVQGPKSGSQRPEAEAGCGRLLRVDGDLAGGAGGAAEGGREGCMDKLLNFPQLRSAQQVAQRLSPAEALENLRMIESTQRLLYTNVQEALALEVGLLKLHL